MQNIVAGSLSAERAKSNDKWCRRDFRGREFFGRWVIDREDFCGYK
jgi:hypothetical protein